MELTIDAKERLEEVAVLIEEEPKRFDMGEFAIIDVEDLNKLFITNMLPVCGTVCCIAGWICVQELRRSGLLVTPARLAEIEDISQMAADILSLDSAQEDALFYRAYWPDPFMHIAYQEDPQTLMYAVNGAARIRHFIATNGAE